MTTYRNHLEFHGGRWDGLVLATNYEEMPLALALGHEANEEGELYYPIDFRDKSEDVQPIENEEHYRLNLIGNDGGSLRGFYMKDTEV